MACVRGVKGRYDFRLAIQIPRRVVGFEVGLRRRTRPDHLNRINFEFAVNIVIPIIFGFLLFDIPKFGLEKCLFGNAFS